MPLPRVWFTVLALAVLAAVWAGPSVGSRNRSTGSEPGTAAGVNLDAEDHDQPVALARDWSPTRVKVLPTKVSGSVLLVTTVLLVASGAAARHRRSSPRRRRCWPPGIGWRAPPPHVRPV